jgi:hypothetical protein
MTRGQIHPGNCLATLFIADDLGENFATMGCQLPKGHPGPCREEYDTFGIHVCVTWTPQTKGKESA